MLPAGPVAERCFAANAGRRGDGADEAILLSAALDPEPVPVEPAAGESADVAVCLAGFVRRVDAEIDNQV